VNRRLRPDVVAVAVGALLVGCTSGTVTPPTAVPSQSIGPPPASGSLEGALVEVIANP